MTIIGLPRFLVLRPLLTLGLILTICLAFPQTLQVDGKTYRSYNPSFFKPHRGVFYNIFVATVLTVDPLGLQGKSTYGVALGSRLTLWESRTVEKKLTGLKVTGLYTSIAYEYYPKQYDKMYLSFWLRVKTFMPLAARVDYIYAKGYGLYGTNMRVGFGFEIRKASLFFCGEQYGMPFFKTAGKHPESVSPYANVGSILLVVPVFTREDHVKK